jgi:beta-lactam-binding protein with PASTA domain
VEVGSTVTLTVSAGNLVTVPDVVGRTVDEARGALGQAGFDVEVVDASDPPSNPDEIGRVASQDPGADAEAERASTVTIAVYPQQDDLEVSETVDDLSVTLEWDNGIFGPVTIDWGDGSQPESGDASSQSVHTYTLPVGETEGTFTITVTGVDPSDRSQQVEVTVTAPGP